MQNAMADEMGPNPKDEWVDKVLTKEQVALA
jgi:hypothetical protein